MATATAPKRPKKAPRPPSVVPGLLEASVKPFEALGLQMLPDVPEINDGIRAAVVACNGSVYMGSEIEAQLRLVRLLRTRPDIAAALGVGTDRQAP